jgi:metal-responsive CopG/Arc/MetJ family transcriptional regulator
MKQPVLNISFTEEDIDLFYIINKISASRKINRSGLVRELLRNSLNEYDRPDKNRTETQVSIPTL